MGFEYARWLQGCDHLVAIVAPRRYRFPQPHRFATDCVIRAIAITETGAS